MPPSLSLPPLSQMRCLLVWVQVPVAEPDGCHQSPCPGHIARGPFRGCPEKGPQGCPLPHAHAVGEWKASTEFESVYISVYLF